jgi:fumarate hydratase class II
MHHAYGYVKKAVAVNVARGGWRSVRADVRESRDENGGTAFAYVVDRLRTQSNMNVNEAISNRAIQLGR